MRRLVPDASVLLKWVLPSSNETLVSEAIAVRDAHVTGRVELLLPSLWLYEAGNTLARKYPTHGEIMHSDIVDFGIRTVEPTSAVLRTTFDLVRRWGVTFYDASYHALALAHRATLITADERYFAKAKEAGSILRLANFAA